MRSLFSSLALVSVLATASAPAFAAPLTAQEEAQARFQTGLKYYDARDFESARLAFTQAYAVLQKPGILLNLALSELYADHPLEAMPHLEQYLKDGAPPPDKRERARSAFDEAFKKTGHLVVKTAPEATVVIDGKPAAVAPPSVMHVAVGMHVLDVKLGAKSKSVSAEAHAGETTTLVVTFEKDPTPAVAVVPPPVTEPPPEPTHTSSFWGWRSIGGIGLVAVGAVGIVVGVAAKSSESSDKDKVKQLSQTIPPGSSTCATAPSSACTGLHDALQSRNDASARAGTFFVLGGVFAGVGAAFVASALVWPHRRDASSAGLLPHLSPVAGPGQGGFLFTSDF